ncbi:MAG: hypothetical protein JJ913_16785 [Rhizobiaceae bacterium]|nr:hypothetical protein [Rhizobiaceae bacterium]
MRRGAAYPVTYHWLAAKAARTLDDGAIEGLRASTRHYVANAARFSTGLKPA